MDETMIIPSGVDTFTGLDCYDGPKNPDVLAASYPETGTGRMRDFIDLLRDSMKAGSAAALKVLMSSKSHSIAILLALTAHVPAVSAAPAPASLLPGGPSKWILKWSEEFDGLDANLDERWNSQNGPSGHILCSRWRENAKVNDGTLRLINKKEKRGGQDWTSGSITTKEKFLYGYFECRYRYAAAEGTNNSFWLMTHSRQVST